MGKGSPHLSRRLGLAAAASVLLVPVLSRRRRGRAAGRRGLRVRDVMAGDVLTVDASQTLVEAAEKMQRANVGVLPVVENGELRGVITDRDIVVRAIAQGADPATTRVAQSATQDVICARPDSTIDEAMEVMADAQVGRLPVVDERNRVIGIVTLGSLALRSTGPRQTLRTAAEVSRRSARASALILATMLFASSAFAQTTTPTAADIAACNLEAEAQLGTPSASPRTEVPGNGAAPRPRAGTPGKDSTDPSGAIVLQPSDPTLVGLSTARAGDPAYVELYRACMKRRGY